MFISAVPSPNGRLVHSHVPTFCFVHFSNTTHSATCEGPLWTATNSTIVTRASSPRVDLHRPPHTLLISSLISAAVWACFGGDSSFSFSPRWSSPLLVSRGLVFPNWSHFRAYFWMMPFQPILLLFGHWCAGSGFSLNFPEYFVLVLFPHGQVRQV